MAKQNLHIDLLDLDRQLVGVRRHVGLLARGGAQSADHWGVWSSAMDEAVRLVELIARVPAKDAADLAIKIGATAWFLEATDAVLDVGGMRQLRALVKDARRLARGRKG